MSLLANQSSLPRLPVPPLRDTLAKLLRTLQPLCDAEQFSRVLELAESFAASAGPMLQEQLEARDRNEARLGLSWLARWWDDHTYLLPRYPLPVNVSFGMALLAPPPPQRTRCALRAASLCVALLRIKHLVDTRMLTPDEQPSDQLPYTRVFGACRVPGPRGDSNVRYDHKSSHLAVVRGGAWWVVETGWYPGASLAQLEQALEHIVQQAPPLPASSGVGVLTAAHRDAWYEAHQELLHAGNEAMLLAIRSAAFVVCLDDNEQPATLDERCSLVLHASPRSCANRWYDKTLQLIVFGNGHAGLCGEHGPVDGAPVARIVDMMVDTERELLASNSVSSTATAPLEIRRLTWQTNASLLARISAADEFARRELSSINMHQCVFDAFGKDLIKRLGVSPDAFCQAMLQLAFHRAHGCFAPTYESASTARFASGRTETGRTLTPELARFVRTMADASSSREQRRALLVLAAKAHVAYMRMASQGLGVDRHLLAMRLLSPQGDVHPFLNDSLVRYSHHWRLSTSQLPVTHMTVSFGPAVMDGYGVCYQPHAERLHFSVSAFRAGPCADVHAYSQEIVRAGRDLRALFDATPAAL